MIVNKLNQMCSDFNCLNVASKHAFTTGPNLMFDEDGGGSHLKFNPARQYKKDKQDKYWIGLDCSSLNVTIQIDVYQRFNDANVENVEEI